MPIQASANKGKLLEPKSFVDKEQKNDFYYNIVKCLRQKSENDFNNRKIISKDF